LGHQAAGLICQECFAHAAAVQGSGVSQTHIDAIRLGIAVRSHHKGLSLQENCQVDSFFGLDGEVLQERFGDLSIVKATQNSQAHPQYLEAELVAECARNFFDVTFPE